MGLVKTFALVAVAAGGGAFVGDKLAGFVQPKLPSSAQSPGVQTGVRVGAQAASAVALYAVLTSIF